MVTAEVCRQEWTICYDANGGMMDENTLKSGEESGDWSKVEISGEQEDGKAEASVSAVMLSGKRTHLRINTLTVDAASREGYTLIGWNTKPDGSGTSVGLGSRISYEEGMTLYAIWKKWTPSEAFLWEESGSGIMITGLADAWPGEDAEDRDWLVIPAEIEGKAVYTIAKDAFANSSFTRVVLPLGLKQVEARAFENSAVEELYLYDDIQSISDYSFAGCENFTSLHINAVEEPVYSRNYFAAFADKFDYLLSIRDQDKIVLFSGSSTRFGYDSQAIEEAFAAYKAVNMGVFAYTNALPQLELIRSCMKEGDILIDSPEFDAAQRQFCTQNDLGDDFYCMLEANYDMLTLLDLREYSGVFSSLTTYLKNKEGMEALSYADTPAAYDEDGYAVDTPSYNRQGDYILYRPNADSVDPVYGLGVAYTKEALSKESFIDPLNRELSRFTEAGVRVFFTYAPRNKYAISEESDPGARAELETYLAENLCVPVLGTLEESLYEGTYLYGTDNHLSTEGVAIRTARIIEELEKALNSQDAGK